MPAWNNPKGRDGITVNGDLGLPNTDAGKGTAFGARATLGSPTSVSRQAWRVETERGPRQHDVGRGVAQFRAIGGSLIPIALHIQLGAERPAPSPAPPFPRRRTSSPGPASA